MKNLVVAITGASGSIYAKLLLDELSKIEKNQINNIGIILSKNANSIWQYELNSDCYKEIKYKIYENDNFYAPFASGSSIYNSMIIIPCSMGTMGRISSGVSSDLISRTADVMLKERNPLVLVTRESPYSLIHIENMKSITLAGGVICPANPSLYNKPTNINDLLMPTIHRSMKLVGLEPLKMYKWQDK